MTNIISVPSKQLRAVFNVKVSAYLLPSQNEGQLAAAAVGGYHSEAFDPQGFEEVLKKSLMGLF